MDGLSLLRNRYCVCGKYYSQLVEDVRVYGKLAGSEASRHQRNWTLYETILSGDVNEPDDADDSSYHVVKGANETALDG